MDSTELIKYFRGRSEWIAVGHDNGFRPEKLEEPLTAERVAEEHLAQKQCIGFYLLDEQSRVWCSCLDFDNHPDNPDPDWRAKAQVFYHLLSERGLSPVMEVSSSGSGAHLWLHFSEPLPAHQVRSFWKKVAAHVEIPVSEIYPRQDTLDGKKLGNLVRLPGWNKSMFVDEFWERTELEVRPVGIEDLVQVAAELGHSIDQHSEAPEGDLSDRVREILKYPDSVLSRRWRCDTEGLKGDQSKSTLAFCICRELVYLYVPPDEIKAALKVWMVENDYLKHINDDRWINRTLKAAYKLMGERDRQPEKGEQDQDLAACARLFISQVGTHQYMTSGIRAIDQSIDGVARGELALLVARPGHGKSTLALQWLLHQSSLGNNTLMLSAEMSHYELGRRMIQMIVGGDEKTWINHRKTVETQIQKHFQEKNRPFVRCLHSIAEVEDAIDQYVTSHAVSLVAVDYIQLLDGGKDGRYEEVTEISRRLKNAARTHNVGILALCQASRGVERRDNVSFQLSDLRESGQLEQDADLVLASWWFGRGAETDSKDQRDEITALKRRNGPIRQAKMELRFVPEKQHFTD